MKQISQTFVNDQSYEAYIKYLAMKKHFTTDSYDYFKYNGKVRASMDTFRTRNDSYFFTKLAKREDYLDMMLANMLVKPNIWIRELLDEEANFRYIEWKKRQDSLTHSFKSELKLLDSNYQTNFVSRDGQHPFIMTAYSQKMISLETFTILTHSANIFDYWDKVIVDRIISRDIIRLAKKYKPFLAYDEKKFKDIIRDHFF